MRLVKQVPQVLGAREETEETPFPKVEVEAPTKVMKSKGSGVEPSQ